MSSSSSACTMIYGHANSSGTQGSDAYTLVHPHTQPQMQNYYSLPESTHSSESGTPEHPNSIPYTHYTGTDYYTYPNSTGNVDTSPLVAIDNGLSYTNLDGSSTYHHHHGYQTQSSLYPSSAYDLGVTASHSPTLPDPTLSVSPNSHLYHHSIYAPPQPHHFPHTEIPPVLKTEFGRGRSQSNGTGTNTLTLSNSEHEDPLGYAFQCSSTSGGTPYSTASVIQSSCLVSSSGTGSMYPHPPSNHHLLHHHGVPPLTSTHQHTLHGQQQQLGNICSGNPASPGTAHLHQPQQQHQAPALTQPTPPYKWMQVKRNVPKPNPPGE